MLTIEQRAPSPSTLLESLRRNLNRDLLGKSKQVDLVIACLLARGHLLLDDLPGTGKTTLAKSLAECLGGSLSRVQCTPDLLATDITGFNMFNPATREFEFHPGPVFADVMLADELNRTTPRTQSALLEAMAERQVTIDNHQHVLKETFFVIATQNPVDSHGAYPLPEAQLDRFTIKLAIGYPDRATQLRILSRAASGAGVHGQPIEPLGLEQLAYLQNRTRQVSVSDPVSAYIVDLVEATRNDPDIELGVSPRGMLHWQAMAQGWALLDGRQFITPSDVFAVAQPVLAARLLTREQDVDAVIKRILQSVPSPEVRVMVTPIWIRSGRAHCRRRPFALLLLIGGGILVGSAGCGSESSTERTTHFDEEHYVPPHWPNGLADHAAMLRQRLSAISGPQSEVQTAVRSEIGDLILWAPEIAADSDLGEADWLPIYRASESLRTKIPPKGWEYGLLEETEQLLQLLQSAADQLAESTQQIPADAYPNNHPDSHEHTPLSDQEASP